MRLVPRLAVAADPFDPRIAEYGCIEFCGFFRLRIEPQKWADLLFDLSQVLDLSHVRYSRTDGAMSPRRYAVFAR
jgi:hypothetical protein